MLLGVLPRGFLLSLSYLTLVAHRNPLVWPPDPHRVRAQLEVPVMSLVLVQVLASKEAVAASGSVSAFLP